MRQTQHRAQAWILTLIIIVAASCFGAVKTLNRMADDVQAVFIGVDNETQTPPSIAQDLRVKAGYAWNMATIAKKHLEPLQYAPLENAITVLENSNTPRAAFEASDMVSRQAEEVQRLLENLADMMKDTDYTAMQKCIVNMRSLDDVIARSGYNDTAAQFNEALDRFPANVFAGIFSIKGAELYE